MINRQFLAVTKRWNDWNLNEWTKTVIKQPLFIEQSA